MQRPFIKIKKDKIDKILELITLIGVLAAFGFPIIFYPDLPEQIPIHFDATGKVDNFDHKSMIWLIPLMSLIMCYGLFKLTHYPHYFNYLQKITTENAEANYKIAQRTLRLLNLIISLSFAYIIIQSILVALGRSGGLGSLFMVVFLIAIIVVPLLPMLIGSKSKEISKN